MTLLLEPRLGHIMIIEGDRITLPREFRKHLKLRKGNLLEYKMQNGSLVLSIPSKIQNPTKRLFGIASEVSGDLSGDILFLGETETKLHRSKLISQNQRCTSIDGERLGAVS